MQGTVIAFLPEEDKAVVRLSDGKEHKFFMKRFVYNDPKIGDKVIIAKDNDGIKISRNEDADSSLVSDAEEGDSLSFEKNKKAEFILVTVQTIVIAFIALVVLYMSQSTLSTLKEIRKDYSQAVNRITYKIDQMGERDNNVEGQNGYISSDNENLQ